MFLLGLTGDIAAGKSTVARLLQQRGAAHIDADDLVRELYTRPDFAARVAQLFDNAPRRYANHDPLITPDGSIDRRALGSIVFADAAALRQLEALVHPAVMELRDEKLHQLSLSTQPPRVVVLEAVKLVESGHAEKCDALWWVQASPETQLRRLMEHRGLSEGEAMARLANQPQPQVKLEWIREKSFVIIGNDGTPQQLEEAVEAAWQQTVENQC